MDTLKTFIANYRPLCKSNFSFRLTWLNHFFAPLSITPPIILKQGINNSFFFLSFLYFFQHFHRPLFFALLFSFNCFRQFLFCFLYHFIQVIPLCTLICSTVPLRRRRPFKFKIIASANSFRLSPTVSNRTVRHGEANAPGPLL